MSSTHEDAVSARVRRAPQLATSLSASVSSGRVVLGAAKHKNWRANYLRALNIYMPDVDPARARSAADAAVARQRSRSSTASGVAVPNTPVAESVGTSSRRRGLLGHRSNADDMTGNARRSNSSANSSNSSGNRSAGSAVSRLLGRHHPRSSSSSSSTAGAASGSPQDEKNGSYVFGMRSHLFRARRPTSRNDYLVVDRVSAPIEIPTARTPTQSRTPHASERGSNCKSLTAVDCEGRSKPQYQQQQQAPAQLLSWEEPSVMMGDNGWPLEVDKPNINRFYDRECNQFESNDLPFVVNRRPPTHPVRSSGEYGSRLGRSCGMGIPEEECEDTEDDETLDLDRADDSRDDEDDENDDDDIFKMEELGSEDSDSACQRPQQQLRRTSSGRFRNDPFAGGDYGAMGAGRRRGSLPTPTTARRRGNQDDADEFRALSESFVPPHQMVERDCFSLGLRDELKRRPLRT